MLNDRCLITRVEAEELNVDKRTGRQIITNNFNIKKVCSKIVP